MRRLARVAPYAALLAAAAWLYVLAGRIEYIGGAGRIGPDFWPKAILGLLALLCAYEIAKEIVFGGRRAVRGVLQSLMEEAGESMPAGEAGIAAAPPSWARLAAGIGVTLAYVLLVGSLGFFVATAAFLAGFIRIGGYRRGAVTLAAALGGSFAMLVVFMKVVYISLPLGAGPFRALSLGLLALLGVR